MTSDRPQPSAPRLRRVLLLIAVSVAVVLMHSAFGAHCGTAAAAPAEHGGAVHHAATGGEHVAASDGATVEKATSTMDCGMAASCTFLLPGPAAIVALAVLVLLIYPPRELFARVVLPRRIVLGRPPPWAIATHVSLGVFRH